MAILGIKRNNPLNLRFVSANHWKGKLNHDGSGFESFSSAEYGYRAAYRCLLTYKKKGILKVSDVISRWAPSCENNTDWYINFVCDYKYLPSDNFFDHIYFFMCRMALVENNIHISPKELRFIIHTTK